MGEQKERHLEAMRGIAALIVVACHSMLAFMPEWTVPPANAVGFTLQGTLVWPLVNGGNAVTFFFVLSGYVLTRRFLLTGDRSRVMEGIVKRWPRLVGPVLVTVLLSWALLAAGANQAERAIGVTGSPWLGNMGTATGLQPDLWQAVKQGAFYVFFRGDATYNGALWTMRYEVMGSFVAYAFALILSDAKGKAQASFLIFLALAVGSHIHPFYVAFVVGVLIAYLKPQAPFRLAGWQSAALGGGAYYLAGYVSGVGGMYAPLDNWLPSKFQHTYPYVVSAAMLFAFVEGTPSVMRVLQTRTGLFLGRISFPVYLLHNLVICSAGATLAIVLGDAVSRPTSAFACIALTGWLSVVASVPMAAFNDWWLARTNGLVRALLGSSRPGLRELRADSSGIPARTA